MNQDSEQNDRRDGDPQQRSGRSTSRRDDDRSDSPRFNRDTTNRSNASDRSSRDGRPTPRPSFNRDRSSDSQSGRSGDRPRFERDRTPGTDKPRFDRDRTPGADKPRFDRDRTGNSDKPRFDRKRDDTTGSSSPRSDRFSDANPRSRFDRSGDLEQRRPSGDRNDDRQPGGSDRFNRDNDRSDRSTDRGRFGSERRFSDRNNDTNRSDNDRPRFNRDDRDRSEPGSRSTHDRSGNDFPRRTDRPNADRPRFTRNDGPRNDGPRDENRPRRDDDRPRPTRDGGPRDENRPRRDNDRPRFTRDGGPRDGGPRDGGPRDGKTTGSSRFSDERKGSDKPAFKRVGGFNREADERNRFGDDRTDNSRRNSRSSDSSDDRNRTNGPNSRFSPQQRKDSGDRRTGRYTKAPNYNLENTRASDSFNRDRRPDARQPERTRSTADENHRREPSEPGLTRLNRYIANSGVCSRREADELIARGDISVNGKVVTEMGYKVKEGDTVKYGTKQLNPERFVYLLLNKPKDYITTTEDPEERKTVMELVADAGNFRMYPVGRLDRNTTGLLLLTNDGELADKLTHPSNNIRKIYQVELDKPITNEHFEAIQRGIELEDGLIKPDSLSIVTPDAQVIGIEIHSGRNRIVRRMFEHFGYEVAKLDRTVYAGLTKKELPRGKWRFLDPKEVVKLKYLNS